MNNQTTDHISKGDAGNAATAAAYEVAQERAKEVTDQARTEVIGTPADTDGRYIPSGGAMDDIRVREVARYFDVNPSEFRDAASDLSNILQAVAELSGQSAMSDLLLTISEMEQAIRPAHASVKRYVHFKNYLLEKMVEYDVRKKVRAWEQ